MKVMVTGAAGFIGFYVSKRLLERGDEVIGIDNLNNYYDVSLKVARLTELNKHPNFLFYKLNISDRDDIAKLFVENKPERVINLAAQAGVRYSIENPHSYVDSNLVGFMNILEGCRHNNVEHLVYASSSSVYGSNRNLPFSVSHSVNHPISLYAATKKSNELMAHVYSHLYNIPTTGLRFFTVYGPSGRPDMAPFLFTKAILEGRPIDVYNYGNMRRDFTYIDDIVTGVICVLDTIAKPDISYIPENPTPESSSAPYRLYNIGNHQSVELNYFIELIEKGLGKKAIKNMLPMQPGDVEETYADIDSLITDVGFSPNTSIEDGVAKFLDWYIKYYICE